ncbi:hypothetical protein [Fuerstiella marisgermanici]|uniref:PAS domain-containing protein n=1 Tax=Fuerstiella marisgermanici TaxID=1891926 RepID=A0A1P8WM27_9PLAN|nr:hypothetical protein [Fuerstiella marisgermanici]APZ95112.1 hypothetical protein Fuma_04766 [Fuerstiella marisgermanici]
MSDHNRAGPDPDFVEQLRADGSPAIQTFLTPAGHPEVINQTMRRFIADGSLASWEKLFDANDFTRWQELITSARSAQIPVSGAFRLRRFDQALRTFVLRAEPRYSSQGEFVGHIVSGMDITGLDAASQPAETQAPEFLLESGSTATMAKGWHQQLVSVSTVISGCIDTLPDLLPEDPNPNLQQILASLYQANSRLRKTVAELAFVARSVDHA